MIKLIKKYSDFILMVIIIIAFCCMLIYFGNSLEKHLTDINYTEMLGRWK